MRMMGNDLPMTIEDLTGASGSGVRALVLDSGVEITHPEVAGRQINCWRVVTGPGGVRRVEPDDSGDAYGHGTACASLLCRFAPGATVDSVKVMGQADGWSNDALAGLHWGIDRGYDVINCSFSTPDLKFLGDYKAAVDRAFCRNVLLVAACNNGAYWRVGYPGSFPTVFSTDFGAMEALAIRHRRGELVEFIARGQQVRVAWKGNSYRVMTGSSLAAPHLAALVCRIRQRYPRWNACEVKAALYQLAAAGASLARAGDPSLTGAR